MSINKMAETQKKAAAMMKAGEGSLKTHLFKWSPNYLEASPRFMQASEMFENIGQYDQAIKCYEKLALCNEKLDDLYGAAEAYNKIGFIKLTRKADPVGAYSALMKSVNLFKIHGNLLKAQDMLKKLAKRCFEMHHEDLGAQIFKALIDELFDEANYGTGAEVLPEYLNYLIEKDRYPEVIDIYNRHIEYLRSIHKYEHLICRAWLGIISIHIVMGEHFIADEKLGQFGAQIARPTSTDEYVAAMRMIDAIQKGDDAQLAKTLKMPIFSQIESVLYRKLKKYRIPSKEEVKKVANPLFGNAEQRAKQAQEDQKASALPHQSQPQLQPTPEEKKQPLPADPHAGVEEEKGPPVLGTAEAPPPPPMATMPAPVSAEAKKTEPAAEPAVDQVQGAAERPPAPAKEDDYGGIFK
jgi:hypothetical protein